MMTMHLQGGGDGYFPRCSEADQPENAGGSLCLQDLRGRHPLQVRFVRCTPHRRLRQRA